MNSRKQGIGSRAAPEPAVERPAVRGIAAASAPDLALALLQATDYGILMTDPQGSDLVVNRRFGEIFGLQVAQVVEMSRDQIRNAMGARLHDPVRFFAQVDAIYKTPEWEGEDEVEIIWPEPRVLRRATAPVRDGNGRAVGRIWTFLDITETRQLQAHLARTAAALETEVQKRTHDLRSTTEVLQAMTQVVAAVSRAASLPELVHRITAELRSLFGHRCAALLLWEEQNRQFRGAFAAPGLDGPDAEGSATTALSIPAGAEPDLEAAVAEMACDQPARLREYQSAVSGPLIECGCGAGHMVPLLVEGRIQGLVLWSGGSRVERIREQKGAQIEAVAALVGIAIETHLLHVRLSEALAELREAQAQLVQTERVAAAATLATSVAHDIRNIMTPLTIELGMLPGEADGAVRGAREQVQRLSVLTQRLLAIARPTRVVRQRVSLVELLRRLEPLLRAQAEVENCCLTWEWETDQAEIEADDSQLEQVIVNLVLNGIQAMAPQGGEVVISLATCNDLIRLSVRDHGNGILPDAREAIFRPFYTTKHSGTGLGLYSSRRIIEEHGGTIEVDSPSDPLENRGATFTLVLPVGRRPAAARNHLTGADPAISGWLLINDRDDDVLSNPDC